MNDNIDYGTVVSVENLSKRFKIPLEASSGIKQSLINLLKNRKGYREFSPIDGISFTVKRGEFFGILGRNGSGKSTLLKTLAGIYTPNTGHVHVEGTLVPFIELGVGFNPELTGKENVFLNGALLGFSRKEMEAMYDDIVTFAELHDFMEERLKNYSSGMQVRLAFSIAIKAQGDILLLDEVLAVGDAAFQQKCFDYFDELKAANKTVILVTHDMSAVLRFCTKALLMDNGNISYIGSPEIAAKKYFALNVSEEASDQEKKLVKKIKNKHVSINASTLEGKPSDRFVSGEKIVFDVQWKDPQVKNIGVAIIKTSGEYVYATNTFLDKFKIKDASVKYSISASLSPGEYNVMVGLFGATDQEQLFVVNKAGTFIIEKPSVPLTWEGLVKLDSKWLDSNV